MKSFLSCCFLILIACGCASRSGHGGAGLVLEPVGPQPSGSSRRDHQGTLIVYTALDQHAHFNGSAYHRYYSDYEIRSETGAVVKKVHNDSGSVVDGPVEVPLESGRYQVRAKANGYGWVTVPVIIENGRVTTVHLEGGKGTVTGLSKAQAVRLPHGEIAGWRALPWQARWVTPQLFALVSFARLALMPHRVSEPPT